MGFPTTATIWDALSKRWIIAVAAVFVLPFWIVFLIPSLPVCLAVWSLGRKRVQWNILDFLILLAPYLVWMALAIVGSLPKSMSNVIEILGLGLAVNLAPIIRLVLPRRWNGKMVAATLLVLACGVAAGIYFSVPCLPE